MNLDAKIRKVSRQHEKIIVFLVTKKGWKNQPSNSYLVRRKRDSNPRYIAVQRFSRPPRSTTLPFLRCKDTTFSFLKHNRQKIFLYLLHY